MDKTKKIVTESAQILNDLLTKFHIEHPTLNLHPDEFLQFTTELHTALDTLEKIKLHHGYK